MLLMSNIQNNSFGVFFKPIAAEFNWSRGTISGAYAVRSIMLAIFAVPMGYFADRYGPRRIILPSLALFGVCYLLSGLITQLWQFYAVQGVLLGLAAAGPWVVIISTVAKWHDKRRGIALGITSAGTGLSSVIFPPLATAIITNLGGWQDAYFALGLMILAVAVPASLFVKDPPLIQETKKLGTQHVHPFAAWILLPKLLGNRTFFLITLMFLFLYISCNLVVNHLVNFITDTGISALTAAGMVSVMGIASTSGRLVMGFISDRIGTKMDAFACVAMVTVSLLLLLLKIPVLLWVAVVFFGIGFGGAAPLVPAIIGDYFGTRKLSTLTGAAVIGANLGAAIGPLMGGVLFDATGSYFWAISISLAFMVTALFIAMKLPAPNPSQEDEIFG